jgi:hypothetical protein
MINPYYDPAKLELEMLEFDEPDLSYEYDTLCFWATAAGQIYSASDSGCSCPTPFEDYEGETQTEVIQKLERVGSLEQAERIFDAWNKVSDGRNRMPSGNREKLNAWITEKLKA